MLSLSGASIGRMVFRLAAIQAGFGDWALGAANAVRQAHSKAIVVSANGDPTQYQEMAKSSPYEEGAICR